ncbi:MAG: tetratricopeptide repeat protein [Acidobacteria bacterium]|nr:tetratricopeptide repeat protein [Acidobacteriota bacterium]
MPNPQTPSVSRNEILALAAATLLIFWRATSNGFIDLDDDFYVLLNGNVNRGLTASGLEWAFLTYDYFYWHPLTWISHMIDSDMWGLNPWGHHLTNVLLHVANTILVLIAFLRLTGNRWASILATMIFAWHPLRVESVAWVAERKDLLSAFFWFLSVIFYESYARTQSKKSYWYTIGAMVLGLASKPTLVTLPFAFLLLDYWPLRRSVPIATLITEKIPMFVLAAVSSVLTYVGQQEMGAVATGVLPLSLRISNSILSYARYLGKMIWPEPLAVFYPYETVLPTAQVAGAAALLLAITALCLWQWKRRPYLAVGWFWFLGTLVPTSGIVQVGLQSMADRFTYIPMFGILLALGLLLSERTTSAALYIIPAVLAFFTYHQIGLWSDTITLFNHTLAVTPANPKLRNNLGHALMSKGKAAEAVPHFEEALKAAPTYLRARLNLGMAQSLSGHRDDAARTIEEAVRQQPDSGEAHMLLGMIRSDEGKVDEARQQLEAALRYPLRDDQAAHVHTDLGSILARQGQVREAEQHFRAAIGLQPTLIAAHRNLVAALIEQGRTPEAVRHLTVAVGTTRNPELIQMLKSMRSQPGQ